MNARERGVHAYAFGAGWHLEWRIRPACSPLDAWGAWQRSRFAERVERSLNVAQRTRQKISRHENVLCLVTAYDRAAANIKSHLPRRSKRQRLPGHDTSPFKTINGALAHPSALPLSFLNTGFFAKLVY